MDVATISATVSALKASIDLVGSAAAARDHAKVTAALEDINNRIINMQNAALQSLEKISTMRDEIEALKDGKRQLGTRIAELEHQKSERQKYDLHELAEGVFVLAEIEAREDGRSPHYLCQPCMDNTTKKGVLQRGTKSFQCVLTCPVCKNDYATGEFINPVF